MLFLQILRYSTIDSAHLSVQNSSLALASIHGFEFQNGDIDTAVGCKEQALIYVNLSARCEKNVYQNK
jgi:hypothetical protein